MNITFPERQADVAELAVDGRVVKFRIPPVTGTHSECFRVTDVKTRAAEGYEIAAFVYGALVYRKNDWGNKGRILFPDSNYLRIPRVLTVIPDQKEFGDLAGTMLVDSDLSGEGIEKLTEVPSNFDGWTQNSSGLMVKNNRIAVPKDKWYFDTWDSKNGAVVALFGEGGVEILDRAAVDSNRNYKPLWKVDINSIKELQKRVPVLNGDYVDRLGMYCNNDGNYRIGCAVRVLN